MSDQVDLAMFHASSHEFDFPDYDLIHANRTNHANGLLGLWVAAEDHWISGFGAHVYAVGVSGRAMDLTVKGLWRWCETDENLEFYVAKRKELLAQGVDYIRIVEDSGESAMGIIVNLDAITSFKRKASRAPKP